MAEKVLTVLFRCRDATNRTQHSEPYNSADKSTNSNSARFHSGAMQRSRCRGVGYRDMNMSERGESADMVSWTTSAGLVPSEVVMLSNPMNQFIDLRPE